MRRPKVLLADDHNLMVEALRRLLEPEFDVVGTVTDGRALVAAVVELRPDVVVVDIAMPLLNGLDAGMQLKALRPETKVIYLTQNPDPNLAAEAFRRNASGYLLKSSAASELSTSIHEALCGRSFVTPRITKGMLQSILNESTAGNTPSLTPRQREVVQLLAEGHSMKEVASILNVTPRTVEFHKYRIMGVLKLRSNSELVQYAIKKGMISL